MRPFTHPYNKERVKQRLIEKYKRFGSIVIGYDFDHTIFNYDNEEGDFSCVIDLLKECSNMGNIMVLYTAEPDREKLQWKIEHCHKLGIKVDYVNESPFFKGTAKPYFNILLDDTAGLEEAYNILAETIEEVKQWK